CNQGRTVSCDKVSAAGAERPSLVFIQARKLFPGENVLHIINCMENRRTVFQKLCQFFRNYLVHLAGRSFRLNHMSIHVCRLTSSMTRIVSSEYCRYL